jgi:guanylate kinase
MKDVLGGLSRGLAFVISAPAGTGKTTLVRMLSKRFDCIVSSVSFTTRRPRKNEVQGRDYHFISREEFEKKMAEGEFLEYAEVFGHYYGTSKTFVEAEQLAGKHVVLVIDTQGAIQLMGSFDATFIFISPPNLTELRNRLSARRSETDATIEHRLSWAEKEMALASKYDYHIVNERLHVAYEVLRAIFIAEEHRNR